MSAIAPPPARWWHALENKKVVCRLCRECHIPNGSRGFCFVRANVDGHLELTTYGRSSGFCIDPIEKKPLNHFLPGTPILSFGTAGCNLGCKFCQNWDISKSREVDTLAHQATPDAIVEAAVRAGCRSLAFTYNDPVIWAEYAIDIAKVAHARGLKTVAVTAGYISQEARGEFYQHMDAANVDLKAFTDFFYTKLCQVNLEPILDTLKFLKHETNVWFELTNLMIPGENDSTEETKAMCGWIAEHLGPDVPVHFTAFHPDFKMRDTPPTPPETLVRARQIAIAAGIRYAFVGNVNDVVNQSTYCHACGKMLIERDWYVLGKYSLRGNVCEHCGAVIPGVFDDAGPGKWGNKRQPIIIGGETSELIRITTPMKHEATPSDSKSGGLNIVNTSGVPVHFPAPAAAPPGAPVAGAGPQIDFTAEQDGQILAYARAMIGSALRNELFSSARLPEPLASAPTFGLFVSLHRGKQLRSCKGQWGSGVLSPLGQILGTMARDAAANDPRFPRVTLPELQHLTIEVSLMHDPQAVTARGEERVRSVQVGTHGLVIIHPNGSGLLLPHVATEAKWDAPTFLEHICAKAGLPAGTWRDDLARLITFRARKIEDHPPAPDVDIAEVGNNGLLKMLLHAQEILGAVTPAVSAALAAQALPPALQRVRPEELGVCLHATSGAFGAAFQANSSLLGLAEAAARSLAANLPQRSVAESLRMTFLWQPIPLVPADYPARHRNLGDMVVLARSDGRWALAPAPRDGKSDAVEQALKALNVAPQQWADDRMGRIRLTAYSVLVCQGEPTSRPQSRGPVAPAVQVREPHWAGQFYLSDPAQVVAEVDGYLRAGGYGQMPARKCRAIMLPHAGWRFCGSTMGKTLAGVKIPKTVIILGPKHTPLGPGWSVASHAAWKIPGASVPVAAALAQRLARGVPTLTCESEAHREEHGTEVLLPFLLRLRPDLQIVPVALGQCPLDLLAVLARELAAILNEAQARGEEEPLLVISSDMNHFANEAENRRRDMLALDAMRTGDPRQLHEICMRNEISMCGLLPAVTVMHALLLQTPTIQPQVIDYTTSAAATGDTARVVGYAGVVIE